MAESYALKGEQQPRQQTRQLVGQPMLGRPKPSVSISESEDEIYEEQYELGMLDVGSFDSVVAVSSPALNSNGHRPSNYNISAQDNRNIHATQNRHSKIDDARGIEQTQPTTMDNTYSSESQRTQRQPSLSLNAGKCLSGGRKKEHNEFNVTLKDNRQIQVKLKTLSNKTGCGAFGQGLAGISLGEEKSMVKGFSSLQGKQLRRTLQARAIQAPGLLQPLKAPQVQIVKIKESISPRDEPTRSNMLQENSKTSIVASSSPPKQQLHLRKSRNVSNNVSQLPLTSSLIHVQNRVSSKTMSNTISPITANRSKDPSPNPEEFEAAYCREMTGPPKEQHHSSIQIAPPAGSNTSLNTQRESSEMKSKRMLEYLQKQQIIQERFGSNKNKDKLSAAQLLYSNRHLFNHYQMKDIEKHRQRRLFMQEMQQHSKMHQSSRASDDKYNFLNWKKAQAGEEEGELPAESANGSVRQVEESLNQCLNGDQEEVNYLNNVQGSETEKMVSLESDPDYNPNEQVDVLVGASLHIIRNTENIENGKQKELASYGTSRTRLGATEMIGDTSSPTIKVDGVQKQSPTIKVEARLNGRDSHDESHHQPFAQHPIISCQQPIKNGKFTHTPAIKSTRNGLSQLNAPETYIQNKMMMDVLHRYQIDNQKISFKLRLNDQSKKLSNKQNWLNKQEIKLNDQFRGTKQCLSVPPPAHASPQVASTVNSKRNLDRSNRKNQEESQVSIAQHGSLQQPRYMQVGKKGSATNATSSSKSKKEYSNADVSVCSASVDVSDARKDRKGLPSLSKLFATRLDSVKDLGKQRNQLQMTQQSFGSQSLGGCNIDLNTTRYHRAFPLTTRSSLPKMNHRSGRRVDIEVQDGGQKMVIDQMSNIFKTTISPRIQKQIKAKMKYKNAESTFNQSELLSHSRASLENDMGLLRKSQKGVLPVRLYQPGPIFTPDVNSLDASMFSTSSNGRHLNNQTTRGSTEGVKVLQLFSSTIDIPPFLKPDDQNQEQEDDAEQEDEQETARKQVMKKESRNHRKPLKKIQEAKREDQGSEFCKMLSQKQSRRRERQQQGSSKKKSKNHDIERLVSSQNSSTPGGGFDLENLSFASPKMSHLGDNQQVFGETLKPLPAGFFQSQGPEKLAHDEDKNAQQQAQAEDPAQEQMTKGIYHPDVAEKRNHASNGYGTGLLNIVERRSELAATERQQLPVTQASIENHKDASKDQLSVEFREENDVVQIVERKDSEHHTSKTAQKRYGQAVHCGTKTSSQQAARAVQPKQFINEKSKYAPSFEEFSLIQNKDTSNNLPSNGMDSGFRSPDYLQPTLGHESREPLLASSRQTTNLDENSIKDIVMTSKIYGVQPYAGKVQGTTQNDKVQPKTSKRDKPQGSNVIGEESGESSGLLDPHRSGEFDPIKTLNNFSKQMDKEKARKKRILTKQQKSSLVQPRVNGIPVIPDIVVDPKQVIINHDINFETARLISTARSFKEQNDIIRATATTKAYIGRSKLAPLEETYFIKQPAKIMQGRVENCSVVKGTQSIEELVDQQKDNISFIDFNSLQVFGTGRDSYAFQQSIHNHTPARSVLAATKSTSSASEQQLQQLLLQQKQFIAAQQFFDAELQNNQVSVLVQQNPPVEGHRDQSQQRSINHQAAVKSPNPMRLDETSPLSTGLGMQSPKQPDSHKQSKSQYHEQSSNKRKTGQQNQVQQDPLHRQLGVWSTNTSDNASPQRRALNDGQMHKTVATALRQSSLLLAGPAEQEQLASAQRLLRSVGSDSKSDDGEDSSPRAAGNQPTGDQADIFSNNQQTEIQVTQPTETLQSLV